MPDSTGFLPEPCNKVTKKKWADFSLEWQKLGYVHMKDWNAGSEELTSRYDLISRNVIFGSACLVPTASFSKVFKGKYTPTMDTAELHCRIWAMLEAYLYASETRMPSRFDFIFDQYDNTMHQELISLWRELRIHAGWNMKKRF